MAQTVNVPGVGILQFPDGMSQQDMAAAIQRNFPQIHGQAAMNNSQDEQPATLGDYAKQGLQSAGRMIEKGVTGIPGIFADGTAALGNILTGHVPLHNPDGSINWSGQADSGAMQLPSQATQQALEPVLGKTPGGAAGIAEAIGSGVVGAKLPLPSVQDANIGVQGLAAAKAADASGGTLGMQTGNTVVQTLESTLARLPGGGALANAMRLQTNRVADTTDSVIRNLSGGADTSATGAGKVLEAQLEAAGQRAKDIAKEGYDKLEELLPAKATIPVTNTTSLLRSLTRSPPGATATMEQVVSPRLQNLSTAIEKDLEAAEGGGLPYGAVKAVRSQIGQQIDWGPFSTNPDNGALKLVYGALSKDMAAGAKTFGPDVAKAVDQVNAEYAAAKNTSEVLQSVLNKNGGPEKVFSALMSGTREGSTTLDTVLANIPQQSRNVLAASALQRMGRATPGAQNAAGNVFSADTFLTNWNRMSPEARGSLFGKLPDGYADSVTQIANNVAKLKAYSRVISNPSNTAQAAIWGGEVGGALTALMTGNYKTAAGIAGTAAGTAVLSAALTNPKTAAYLAKQTAAQILSFSASASQ